MSLPQWLCQLQEQSRWLQIIQRSSLRVGLPLILATACLSCADPTSTSSTPNAWQDSGTNRPLSDVPPETKPADTDNISQSSQLGDDYSQFANGPGQAATRPANYQGNGARSGAATTNDRFQLPDVPTKRQQRAVPLVDRAPF